MFDNPINIYQTEAIEYLIDEITKIQDLIEEIEYIDEEINSIKHSLKNNSIKKIEIYLNDDSNFSIKEHKTH